MNDGKQLIIIKDFRGVVDVERRLLIVADGDVYIAKGIDFLFLIPFPDALLHVPFISGGSQGVVCRPTGLKQVNRRPGR